MKRLAPKIACALLVATLLVTGATNVRADDMRVKNPANKITAYLSSGPSEKQAVVTLWMANVNPVGAICLPFKLAAPDSFALDSLVVKPYRAGTFHMAPPKYDRDKQTLLVNMLRADDSVKAKTGLIPVGEGVLATLHLSSKGRFPMADFKIAPVQLPPENVLMYVTDTFNSVLPEFELKRESPPSSKGGSATPKSP